MKLQLDSKKDLQFVVDGVQTVLYERIQERCLQPDGHGSAVDWRALKQRHCEVVEGGQQGDGTDQATATDKEELSFEQAIYRRCLEHLDSIVDMVSSNCQVNGRDWETVGDDCVQEMEPVDEQLVAKVDQLRAEVDRSLVRVCGKRTDVPQRMLALATQQFTNVKGDGFDAVEGNPMEEEDVVRDPISVVGDALASWSELASRAAQLPNELAPLLGRLQRYDAFLGDELTDARYEAHRQRLLAELKTARVASGEAADVEPTRALSSLLAAKMAMKARRPMTTYLA